MGSIFGRVWIAVKDFVNKGHSRSRNTKKNILASLVLRGGSIAVSLILVPLTLNYVDDTRYGIWLTISSLVSWFSYFDVGFGHGLRNRFAESIAQGKVELARSYVSTTYAIMSIIMLVIVALFFLVNGFLEWDRVLNTPPDLSEELGKVAVLVFSFFCLQFVLQLIVTVVTANQEPARGYLFAMLANVVSLIVIYVLTKTTTGNLLYLSATLSLSPVIVFISASFWLYNTSYKKYAPSFKYINFDLVSDLMSLGVKFFIIQIGVLVLFSTQNVIITQVFGPKDVTTYNIAYKLFSVVNMIFGIVLAPLWSAFTDAYVRKEFSWIRSTLKNMLKVWVGISFLSFFLLAISPQLYHLWVGDKVTIPFVLSSIMCIQVIAYCFQSIFVFFLNGVGKIQIQLYLIVFFAAINIPVAIFLGNQFGLAGISLTSLIVFVITAGVYVVQTRMILSGTAKGIWDK